MGDLRLDNTASLWRQELVRLQGAALGLDTKERLLEAWGLVLLANNQLEPQNSGNLVLQSEVSVCRSDSVCINYSLFHSILAPGVLERLVSCVQQQQDHMTSCGLLEVRPSSMHDEGDQGDSAPPCREVLQQLSRRAQLWPLMEELAVLNQLRLSTDLLQLALTQG